MKLNYLIKFSIMIFFLIAGFTGDAHTELNRPSKKDCEQQIQCTGKISMLNIAMMYASKGICPGMQTLLDNHKQNKQQYRKCPRENYRSPRGYYLRKYQRVPYFRNFYKPYYRSPGGDRYKYRCPYLYKRC